MNKLELENARRKIYYLFKENIIEKEDIRLISQLSFDEIVKLEPNNKNKILYSIYVYPFLLCNDYMFTNGILFLQTEEIAYLLVRRYNMEIDELSYQFKEYDIKQDEYYCQVNRLKKMYFESSIIGRRIQQYYKNIIKSEKIIKQYHKCKDYY